MKTNERQQSLWNSCLLGEIGNKEKRKKRNALFRKRIKSANNWQGWVARGDGGTEKKQMRMEVAIKFRDKGKDVNLNIDTVKYVFLLLKCRSFENSETK